MFLTRWLRPTRPASPARPHPPARRLGVECLEARDNPSGGLLDPTFDGDGIRTLPSAMMRSLPHGPFTAIQPDGKILTVGSTILRNNTSQVSVVRMNPDGSLDTTFNRTGQVTLSAANVGTAVACQRQPDGTTKILVGASASYPSNPYQETGFVVARLNPDGSLDQTFGKRGVWSYNPTSGNEDLTDLAVLPDGSIVGGGNGAANGFQAFAAFKLTPSGSLDPSFGTRGYTTIQVGTAHNGNNIHLAVTPTGGVVLSGRAFIPGFAISGCLVSLTSAGRLDSNFNTGAGYLVANFSGPNTDTIFFDVAVQGDRIVVSGVSTLEVRADGSRVGSGLVARYTMTGALDTSFAGGTGYYLSATPSWFWSVAVAADGSIVVGGLADTVLPDGSTQSGPLVGHLTADGAVDTAFGPAGTGFFILNQSLRDTPMALAIGPDGSILLTCDLASTDGRDFIRLTAP